MLDSRLRHTWKLDREYLHTTEVPIITVSGTYHEDLKGLHDLPEDDQSRDLVFSRAHYSMAIGVAIAAWKEKIDPKKAWIVDPTNYVSKESWGSVMITEHLGRLIARFPALKILKDIVDKFGRRSIPLLKSVTPPLIKTTTGMKSPVLSFHITAGNILLEHGHPVVEMVTDPHVRDEYLANSEKKNAFYCVFDERTKVEFLEKAHKLEKKVDDDRVIVTGPPIDTRVITARENKRAWSPKRTLRLCLTTGGLGTNKGEIEDILKQLLPILAVEKPRVQLMVYCGTHADIKNMVVTLARATGVHYSEVTPPDPAQFEVGHSLSVSDEKLKEVTAPLTILYHPQIIDANELLIATAFPWADGFVTKPSGDMAYDAVASGAFLLTLKEWGEWENNIWAKFKAHDVAKQADTKDFVHQLEKLTRMERGTCWITEAMKKAHHIEKEDALFLSGAKNILKAYEKAKQAI